jgi:hypothetical protein
VVAEFLDGHLKWHFVGADLNCGLDFGTRRLGNILTALFLLLASTLREVSSFLVAFEVVLLGRGIDHVVLVEIMDNVVLFIEVVV